MPNTLETLTEAVRRTGRRRKALWEGILEGRIRYLKLPGNHLETFCQGFKFLLNTADVDREAKRLKEGLPPWATLHMMPAKLARTATQQMVRLSRERGARQAAYKVKRLAARAAAQPRHI